MCYQTTHFKLFVLNYSYLIFLFLKQSASITSKYSSAILMKTIYSVAHFTLSSDLLTYLMCELCTSE